MNSPKLGHNLPPDIFDGTDSLPSGLPKMNWFPLDIQALRKVLIDKPLDQRGFYITVLLAMYEHMEALPADDRMACMRLGGMDIRVYRRMRDLFVDYGILTARPSGRISNARFEEEIMKYVTEYRNRQSGRAKRDETIRQRQEAGDAAENTTANANDCSSNNADLGRTSPGDTPIAKQEVRDKFRKHSPLANGDLFKKDNKINGDASEFRLNYGLNEGGELEREIDSKKEPPKPPKGGDDVIAEQFEDWWRTFPRSVRKVGKGECLALFRQAITGSRRANGRGQKVLDHGPATAEQLIAAAQAYAATNPDPQFVPAPATWLNQGRWLDNPAETAVQSNGANVPWWKDQSKVVKLDANRWREGIAAYAGHQWDVGALGPPPGNPQCVVPTEIISELRLTDIFKPDGLRR